MYKMVLWLKTCFVVVIIFQSYATTCANMENDFQQISSSSIDLLQARFQSYCAKVPLCRYSKFLSELRNSFNAESPDYNLKVKKNLGTRTTEIIEAENNLEGEELSQNRGLEFEESEKSDLASNSYDDLEEVKRGNSLPSFGCDCKVKNELLDLGHLYYPRYLFNAVCHKEDVNFEYLPKCLPGAQCRPLEYRVRVLTHRSHNDHVHKDPTASLLPEALRSDWKFKTVTIAAGCFCS